METTPPGFLCFTRARFEVSQKVESKSFRWSMLLLVMSGVFLSTMDSGMVSIALPTIMRSFDLKLEYAEFVVTLYLLTITITLVLWGKFADFFGRLNIYLLGMATFSVGSTLCFLSGSFAALLLSRIVQALGASMMMSSGPAIIKAVFPVDYLGRSLGLVGIATACGLLTGPFVCGQLLNLYPWKSIFLINLPVSITGLVVGLVLFRNSGLKGDFDLDTADFDWAGCGCWVCLVVLWVTVFHHFNSLLSLHNGILLVAFILVFLLFLYIEDRVKKPILPLFLFREKGYWIGVLTAAISFGSLFSVLTLVPFFLDYILQMKIKDVGMVMMALPATIVILSPTSGWLYDKIGARYLTSFGLGLSGCGIVSISLFSQTSSILAVMSGLAVVGAGQSIFLSPNSASVLANVPDKYTGISSGILATARNLGMMTGATLGAAMFGYFYSLQDGGGLLGGAQTGNHTAFLVAWKYTLCITAAVSFFAAFISIFRRR